MVLDAVLADPDVVWLGAERDKVAHFRACTSLPEEDMPRLIFRSPNGAETVRYFPDRLPIGCHPDGRAPVFLYLVRAWDPFEFRMFLQRHGALLRALAEWRIRLLVPPHLEGAEKPHEVACWNEFATPLKPDRARGAALVFRAAARARRSLAGFRRGAVPPSPRHVLKATLSGALQAVERTR